MKNARLALSFALTAFLAFSFVSTSSAATAIFTLSGIGSGSVDGNEFTDTAFTIEMPYDSSQVTFNVDTYFAPLSSTQSVTISIDGFETATLFGINGMFNYPADTIAGFQMDGSDVLDFTSEAFLTFNFMSSLDPVAVGTIEGADTGRFNDGEDSSLGIIFFSGFSALTASATVAEAPEPSTWALLGIGAVGAGAWHFRRRKLPA